MIILRSLYGCFALILYMSLTDFRVYFQCVSMRNPRCYLGRKRIQSIIKSFDIFLPSMFSYPQSLPLRLYVISSFLYTLLPSSNDKSHLLGTLLLRFNLDLLIIYTLGFFVVLQCLKKKKIKVQRKERNTMKEEKRKKK